MRQDSAGRTIDTSTDIELCTGSKAVIRHYGSYYSVSGEGNYSGATGAGAHRHWDRWRRDIPVDPGLRDHQRGTPVTAVAVSR
jgi:hypothetical protein